jgi:hypothetical protein
VAVLADCGGMLRPNRQADRGLGAVLGREQCHHAHRVRRDEVWSSCGDTEAPDGLPIEAVQSAARRRDGRCVARIGMAPTEAAAGSQPEHAVRVRGRFAALREFNGVMRATVSMNPARRRP